MLGTDAEGSVRVPAAFCGILGFRPSLGAVSVVGVIPMAPSFDTVGTHPVPSLIYSRASQGLRGSLGIFVCVLLFSQDYVASASLSWFSTFLKCWLL